MQPDEVEAGRRLARGERPLSRQRHVARDDRRFLRLRGGRKCEEEQE
jgi:hypothetical protein